MKVHKWLYRFCVVGIAAAISSLICAAIEARHPDGWSFVATIIAVFLVCVVDELILPRPAHEDTWSRFVAPAIRGAIIGLCVGFLTSWAMLALMKARGRIPKEGVLFSIPVPVLCLCCFIPYPTIWGAAAGVIVRRITTWPRKRGRAE